MKKTRVENLVREALYMKMRKTQFIDFTFTVMTILFLLSLKLYLNKLYKLYSYFRSLNLNSGTLQLP
jgi:hypothetical protein